MAEHTLNYGLRKLGPGESISDESYKFADADRDLIDELLHAMEIHHHSGASASSFGSPLDAPSLTLHSASGSIPAGVRVFYKVALVDPNGLETAASPEEFVDTAAALGTPAAAALELTTTGGAHLPGNYYYVLTAYYPVNTSETTAGPAAFETVPVGTTTNKITLHFPLPPTGAVGYNIYRSGPGTGGRYAYLASVPIVGGATPSNYVDDGSVAADPFRQPPRVNATQASNSVDVTLPAGVTPLEAGWTWKVYRTYLASNYVTSLVHHVVEETSTGSGIITTTFTDIGSGTFQGQPLDLSQLRPAPPQVDLTADVTGILPAANGGSGGATGATWARAASTANVSVTAFSGTTLDGVTLANGDPILLKDQTAASENGLWLYEGATNALVRPANFRATSVQSGVLVQVQSGAANAGAEYVLVGTSVTVGTTAQSWRQLAVATRLQMGTLLDQDPSGIAFGSANDAVLVKLVPYRALAVTRLVWFMGAAATDNYDVGVYSDGTTLTRLWNKGSTAAPSINTAVVETVTGVTLAVGVPVWLALAGAGTTITPRGLLMSFNEQVYDDAGVATILKFATSLPLPSTLTKSSGVTALRAFKFLLRSV